MMRRGYPTDLTDAQWALISPHLPLRRPKGRPRRTDLRAVIDAILYLLRTGCQWRPIPSSFPPWGTVWWTFRRWRLEGVWTRLHRALHRAFRPRPHRASAAVQGGPRTCRSRLDAEQPYGAGSCHACGPG